MKTQYDYIIVGAGSAGCVLANRLSANAAKQVLLVEAGGPDTNPWIHIPVGYFKTLHNPNTDWCYKTAPDPGLNGRSLDWPRGKTLGGSSSINGLLYIRGQHRDYDQWRQLGNTGWSFADVLPYFKRAERQERGADEYHGADGPLPVCDMRARRDVCDAFIAGAREIGIPANNDFNGERQEGAGYFQLTTRKGLRCSSAKAYLKPIRKRRNLQVLTHAHVHRLRFAQNTPLSVSGVELSRREGLQSFHLRPGGELILSAGAIGSPQILQLSGIGPAPVLARAGVALRYELPGVGENLQDHLQIRMVYEVNVPTLNDEINNLFLRARIGLEFLLARRGPMTMGASQVCVFAKTRAGLADPDIQFHFQPLSADKPGLVMHPFSGVTSSVCQLRPESRGRISICSPDPCTHPLIEPNYLAHSLDQETAVASMRVGRQIMTATAFAPYLVSERLPGDNMESDEQLLDAARNISQTIYHPVGTCKMGRDPMAVVDHRLRVRGVNNLRIADASIMPTIVSGNTNAPTIMIGEKASDLIATDED